MFFYNVSCKTLDESLILSNDNMKYEMLFLIILILSNDNMKYEMLFLIILIL